MRGLLGHLVLSCEILAVSVGFVDDELDFLGFLLLVAGRPRSLLLAGGLAGRDFNFKLVRALQVLLEQVDFHASGELWRIEDLHSSAVLTLGKLLRGDSCFRRNAVGGRHCYLRRYRGELVAHPELGLRLVHVRRGLLRQFKLR